MKKNFKIILFSLIVFNLYSFSNAAESFFNQGYYPARSLIEVSKLPKNSNIEIEAICYCEK